MKILLPRAYTLAIVQLAIAVMLAACRTMRPPTASSPLPDVGTSPIVGSPSPIPTAIGDPFTKGVDKAASASRLAQSAQTVEDWSLVMIQWQRAIDFMKAVPPSDPNRAAAQKLLAAYQQDLARAQQQAKRGGIGGTSVALKSSGEGGIPLMAGEQSSPGADTGKETATTAAATVNALLQQQTEFFAKQKRYATSLAELGSSIPAETPSYTYSTSVLASKQAIATATAKQESLPSYIGTFLSVKDDKNNDTTVTAVCLTSKPGKVPPGVPQVVGKEIQCPSGSTKL